MRRESRERLIPLTREQRVRFTLLVLTAAVWLVCMVEPAIGTIAIQHDAGGVVFGRWVTGYNAAYSGGGYVYSRWAGEWLEVRFIGQGISWIGPKQPSYGIAEVYMDGVLQETVDCYAPEASKTTSAVLWSGSC